MRLRWVAFWRIAVTLYLSLVAMRDGHIERPVLVVLVPLTALTILANAQEAD